MHRWHVGRRIDFFRFDQPEPNERRQLRCPGGAVALGPLDPHRAGTQHQRGLAGLPARRRGQRDRFATQLRRIVQAVIEAATIVKAAVVVDTDQHIHAVRTQGKFLIDVALAVSDYRHPRCTGLTQAGRLAGCLDPALAFLVLECALVAVGSDRFVTAQKSSAHQAKQPTISSIHRDRGMQLKAFRAAVVAQAGGVLDDQDVTIFRQPQRVLAGGCKHFRRRYPVVTQEAGETDLASATTPQAADAHPRLSGREQAFQQEGPPFSRRASPKWPRLVNITLISANRYQNGIRDRGIRQRPATKDVCIR